MSRDEAPGKVLGHAFSILRKRPFYCGRGKGATQKEHLCSFAENGKDLDPVAVSLHSQADESYSKLLFLIDNSWPRPQAEAYPDDAA